MQKPKKIIRGIEKVETPKAEAPKKEVEPTLETNAEQTPIVSKEKQAEVPVQVMTTKTSTTKVSDKGEKDDITLKIEKVLEEDLEEVYFNLSEEQQEEFKKKGEETANSIRKLMESVKEHAKEIVSLITNWLKIVPGINNFFIEQEAKIKADKILNIKNPK